MQKNQNQTPTDDEVRTFSIKAYRGIEVGAMEFLHGYALNLTTAAFRSYILPKCVETRVAAGMSPRQSVTFFTSHGFTSMGAVEQEHKTRKGNTARLCRYRFLTLAPTNPLRKGLVDLTSPSGEPTMTEQSQGTLLPVASTASIAFQNTTFNIVDRNGAQWLKSQEIAAALGYTDDGSIARIFSRRADEFTDKMTTVVKLTTVTGEKETRIFSLRGAHLLAMFARTAVAKAFRVWVLDVLDREAAVPPQVASPRDVRFNPEDPAALRAIIKLVPRDFLPTVLDAVNDRMPTNHGDISNPEYYRECRAELFKFADSLPSGTQWPADEATRQKIADGYLTDILMGRRWLMSFGCDGRLETTPVERGACVIHPGSATSLATLISEFVPLQLLPKVIDSANFRIAHNLSRLTEGKSA